jgi:UDP-N-acetylmuramoyl-tripeptide--D-alanyl-D-alanine ligase
MRDSKMRWTPETLAQDAAGRVLRRGDRPLGDGLGSPAGTMIAGAFIDSRQPLPGGLFVPIVAARDGHDFAPDAIAGGASAVLVAAGREAPAGDVTVVEVDDTLAALGRLAARARDRVAGPVVSITGSNGKTTTRAMIAAVLATGFSPLLTTRGNLNNHLGVPLTLLNEPHDAAAMVVELGMSAPGENDHLAAIVRPTIAVITSVALEHLEFMGSIEAIAAAEAEPVRHVAKDGAIVVPGDEPLLASHMPGASGPAVLRFAAGEQPRVEVVAVQAGAPTIARLRTQDGEEITLRLRTFGAHNARNAAAALTVGLWLGLPIPPMVRALEAVEPVGDRGRVLGFGPHLLVADCYNANPGSVQAALESLAALDRPGPRIAVLGDMLELGPTEEALHAEVGRQCASLGLSAVITYGPRSAATALAAREAGLDAEHCGEDIAAVVAAIRDRLHDASAGAVLVKGSRGMKLERVVAALHDASSPGR